MQKEKINSSFNFFILYCSEKGFDLIIVYSSALNAYCKFIKELYNFFFKSKGYKILQRRDQKLLVFFGKYIKNILTEQQILKK